MRTSTGFNNGHSLGTVRTVVQAFLEGRARKIRNGSTDGHTLYLHGNPIARKVKRGVEITDCGWATMTTRRWLNTLPGVSVYGHKGEHMLNGQPWDGTPTKVKVPGLKQGKPETQGTAWDMSEVSEIQDGDHWRPYVKPKYAVCGANDTGMWSDSPAPSNVREHELGEARAALEAAGIATKDRVLNSSNVFMVRCFLIVQPVNYDRARAIVEPLIAGKRSLYMA